MNEMKNFFNTASTDTIGECLSGEKLLNASRDAKGNTLLTFESAYEGYSDLLTIMPDGSVIGTFICDEEQRPQTVNDNPTMTDVATLLEDKKLSLMCSTGGMEAEDPSEGMELTFLDYNGKNPDTLLRITPALVDGTPIIKGETQSLNQQYAKTADKQKAAFPCANRDGRQMAGQRIAVMFPALILAERRGIFNVWLHRLSIFVRGTVRAGLFPRCRCDVVQRHPVRRWAA